MEADNAERLRRKGGLSQDRYRQAGVKPLIDRVQEKGLKFFNGDKGKLKAWLISEFPGLKPSGSLLAQLEADDMLFCIAVLDHPEKLDKASRLYRFKYRGLVKEFRRYKAKHPVQMIRGEEGPSELKGWCESLLGAINEARKDFVEDEEFEQMFEAERVK